MHVHDDNKRLTLILIFPLAGEVQVQVDRTVRQVQGGAGPFGGESCKQTGGGPPPGISSARCHAEFYGPLLPFGCHVTLYRNRL